MFVYEILDRLLLDFFNNNFAIEFFRAAIEEQLGKSLVKLAKSMTIREDLE